MSWLRIEGRMPQHHKVAPLSDAAFRLHLTAMAWCVESKTDGAVPSVIPQTLTRAPLGKKLVAVLKELTDLGVWIPKPGGYQIHNFLQWNLSAADISARSEAKSRAGSVGGLRSAQAKAKQESSSCLEPASGVLEVAAKTFCPSVKQNSSPYPYPYPYPLPERDPPTPSVLPPQGGERDIGAGDLRSFSPDSRELKAKSQKKPRELQWCRFPPDFEPDDSHRRLALQLGLNLQQQLTEIRDHQFAKPKSDPAATLRTWLRNAPKFGAGPSGPSRFQQPVSANVEHDSRAALASSRKVREFLEGAK